MSTITTLYGMLITISVEIIVNEAATEKDKGGGCGGWKWGGFDAEAITTGEGALAIGVRVVVLVTGIVVGIMAVLEGKFYLNV